MLRSHEKNLSVILNKEVTYDSLYTERFIRQP